ncbi:MAG TPA: hypothetical protein VEZ11_05135 [Thermoanaerobaculia bacterium]|nr:hypothetical protein [Thermoanaerobaculia bacterium]
MEKQVAESRDFSAQLSGHLNLGDLRLGRNETSLARREYAKAREIAQSERTEARRVSALARYAQATAWAGLAESKLGNDGAAFDLSEEAIRYASDSARTWNLISSTLGQAGRSAKAVSASRNAVAIAKVDLAASVSTSKRLDLAIYQYALAAALIDGDAPASASEAEELLREILESLRSDAFASLRKDIARKESFETYSTSRGPEEGYRSLLNRAQLRLAALYEARGETEKARAEFRRVLEGRTDDSTALAALARLAPSSEERERFFADAFDANPFAISLVSDYRAWLADGHGTSEIDVSSSGGQMRLALRQIMRGEQRGARQTLDGLIAKFPSNDTLQSLAAEADISLGEPERARQRLASVRDGELRHDIEKQLAAAAKDAPPSFIRPGSTAPASPFLNPSPHDLRAVTVLFAANKLAPEQRTAIDAMTFSSVATLTAHDGTAPPGQTIFEAGTIDGAPFRFAQPTAFQGAFAPDTRLWLTYRILGATQHGGADQLLIEPLRLERLP